MIVGQLLSRFQLTKPILHESRSSFLIAANEAFGIFDTFDH
jgi:hypothetical protein